MKNPFLIALSVAGMVAFLTIAILKNYYDKKDKNDFFKVSRFEGVVDHVEFKGKFDRIYLDNGVIFDFVVEPWEEGMANYENVHLDGVIHKNDSIVKESGSFDIRIKSNSKSEEFILIGKGEIR